MCHIASKKSCLCSNGLYLFYFLRQNDPICDGLMKEKLGGLVCLKCLQNDAVAWDFCSGLASCLQMQPSPLSHAASAFG